MWLHLSSPSPLINIAAIVYVRQKKYVHHGCFSNSLITSLSIHCRHAVSEDRLPNSQLERISTYTGCLLDTQALKQRSSLSFTQILEPHCLVRSETGWLHRCWPKCHATAKSHRVQYCSVRPWAHRPTDTSTIIAHYFRSSNPLANSWGSLEPLRVRGPLIIQIHRIHLN